jgi:hypothetical protein
MFEKRRVQRTRVFKGAKIASDQLVCDCLVHDVSSLGARLALIGAANVPDTFELTFDAARTLRKCRIVWRSGIQIGVEFHKAAFRPAA